MAQVRKASGRDRATETTRELPQAISRSSSAGSIRKSITKVPSEGLIVLPPDKEFVRFENGGGSSTNCVSAVRVGSAGRVERNLQMARKKELEDEISTDSASASGITADGELQKGETKCKPLKQTDKLDAKVDHKEEEESESSDSDSSDSDERETSASAAATEAKEGAAQAPVELKGKFLKAVMDEDYENAKELCQKILLLEPDNKTCSEFHAVIVEKIKQEDEKSDDSEESTEESSDETEEDENQESSEDDQDDDDNEEEDDEDNESSSDDDFALPPGPINLIMGGLPIRPQKR